LEGDLLETAINFCEKTFKQLGKKVEQVKGKQLFSGFISLALREGIPDRKSVCTL